MASASRPQAFIVHSTTGRVRFRFPEQRGDAPFFEALAAGLGRVPNVLETRASAHTGSVLVLHTGDLPSLISQAESRELFDVSTAPLPAASFRRMRDAIDSLDDNVAKGTGEVLSVGKLLFLGLLGAGIYQANRGHLLPAGMTLFKHALELMDWVAERESTNSQSRAQSVSQS
ncbi:MAG TPA: hypothetical protein VJR89_20910 [Polyangiales bacterium]|nr:hypothetical protein [Polyangiales bacterium]